MLKAMIMAFCDSCQQQFLFARTSRCELDAWRFNTKVLTVMLQEYDWKVEGSDHYCLECWGELAAPGGPLSTS
jgi:hypothetical protein